MELFHAVFKEDISVEQQIWKYESCLQDCTKVASVWDKDKGSLIGALSAFKRQIIYKDTPWVGYTYGDGMIRPEYQGRGIYRKMFDIMNQSNADVGAILWMGYPNDNAAPIYRKYKNARELYSTHVFVFLNGMNAFVHTYLKLRGLPAWFLKGLGTMMLRSYNHLMKYDRPNEIAMEPIDEFNGFPEQWSFAMAKEHQLMPCRDREFLTWRVKDAPIGIREDILPYWFVKNGDKIGYCVLYRSTGRNVIKLIDLICQSPNDLRGCLQALRFFVVCNDYDALLTNVSSRMYAKAMKANGYIQIKPIRSEIFFFDPGIMQECVMDDSLLFQMPIDRDNFYY